MYHLFHINSYQRAILFVAGLVLLAYAGLLHHQIAVHSGDDTDCAQCLAVKHFGKALASAAPTLTGFAAAERPRIMAVATFTVPTPRYFAARAPPVLL